MPSSRPCFVTHVHYNTSAKQLNTSIGNLLANGFVFKKKKIKITKQSKEREMAVCKDFVVQETRSGRFMLQQEMPRFMLILREKYRLRRSCLRKL